MSVRFHRGLNGLRQTHSLRRLFRRRDDRTCDITYQDWRCGRSYEYLSSVSDIGKCHGQAEYEVLVFHLQEHDDKQYTDAIEA